MDTHKDLFPIRKMSEIFGVSSSGYYRWRGAPPSGQTQENSQLKQAIRAAWKSSGYTYGSPRIHRELLEKGYQVSRPRVARLMRGMGIQSQLRRRWKPAGSSSHCWAVVPNILGRRFYRQKLGQAWVSDITFLPSAHGWLYLTIVMDLADRQIIGWSLSESMDAAKTTVAAWKAACARRPPKQDLLFHSDQGVQYACSDFTRQLKAALAVQSMSRRGNCWDNAPAESFFKTLKAELRIELHSCNYRQVRQIIFRFIEVWYNRKRLHSALDYKTPAAKEQQLKQQRAA